jgi:hypothetical protein
VAHIVLLSSRRPSIADPMEIPQAHEFMPFFCNATHTGSTNFVPKNGFSSIKVWGR